MKMKQVPTLHVTGLCLGGNKGGPAVLLSLLTLLKRHVAPLKVVVDTGDLERDLPWQAYYGVDVVSRPKPVKKRPLRYLKNLLALYRGKDVVVDMHGVKFCGPLTLAGNLVAASSIVLPRMLGIPAVAFTQTYGPFGNRSTRLTARLALQAATLLFARERESWRILETIGLGEKCRVYPDVAMALPLLPLTEVQCSHDLKRFVSKDEPFIGISPSAKVVRVERGLGTPPRYVALVADFANWLIDQGYRVLFIPHSHQPRKLDDDDFRLSLRIAEKIAVDPQRSLVVQEDLPPGGLKTLISRSYVFVGSRYHSLVAALSTGVPSLSIGWSHKYDGLLARFNLRQFSFWIDRVALGEIQRGFERLISDREKYALEIKSRMPGIRKEVEESVEQVASLILRTYAVE